MFSTRTLQRATTLLASVGLLIGLSACSSSSASPEPDTTPVATDNYEIAIADYRQKMDECYAAGGFPMVENSNGMIDTTNFDMDEFNRVAAGCVRTVGEAPVDPSQPTPEEMAESQLVFAKCMRDAGYDYPDPVEGGMSPAFGPETDPDVVDKCSATAYGTGN